MLLLFLLRLDRICSYGNAVSDIIFLSIVSPLPKNHYYITSNEVYESNLAAFPNTCYVPLHIARHSMWLFWNQAKTGAANLSGGEKSGLSLLCHHKCSGLSLRSPCMEYEGPRVSFYCCRAQFSLCLDLHLMPPITFFCCCYSMISCEKWHNQAQMISTCDPLYGLLLLH